MYHPEIDVLHAFIQHAAQRRFPIPPIRVHHLLLFGITRGLHAFVDERIQDEKCSLDMDGKIDIIICPHP